MKEKYTIGMDFGTRSARASLVRISDGAEIGYSEYVYPHGVMDSILPCGKKLEINTSLQHPRDYIEAINHCLSSLVSARLVAVQDIIAIGIDFTASTAMPTDNELTPLCFLKEFEDDPHAYVKLWKHHSTQYCADIINENAIKYGENFIDRFGGKVSSEFYFPKLLQLALEAPDVFNSADYFIEAGDWIVWHLTGQLKRSASYTSYKAFWSEADGYPSVAFLDTLSPGFGEKALYLMRGEIAPVGTIIGNISKEISDLTGLTTATVVCTPIIDAHSALPSAKITRNDEMLMILGTSGCHILLSDKFTKINGILAVVPNAIIPGYYGYESGQSGLGDQFEWMIKNIIPQSLYTESKEKNIHILDLLSTKASKQKPGEHGLIALDWFNGNRCPLSDSELTGTILGFNLNTKIEDIYRALVESIAFGTRKIIENYENNNIPIKTLSASGSISKNDFIMQVYADVLGKKIQLSAAENASAHGSAIIAAATATNQSIYDCAQRMGKIKDKIFKPNFENKKIYDKLYEHYSNLFENFGKSNIMKDLLKLKNI